MLKVCEYSSGVHLHVFLPFSLSYPSLIRKRYPFTGGLTERVFQSSLYGDFRRHKRAALSTKYKCLGKHCRPESVCFAQGWYSLPFYPQDYGETDFTIMCIIAYVVPIFRILYGSYSILNSSRLSRLSLVYKDFLCIFICCNPRKVLKPRVPANLIIE